MIWDLEALLRLSAFRVQSQSCIRKEKKMLHFLYPLRLLRIKKCTEHTMGYLSKDLSQFERRCLYCQSSCQLLARVCCFISAPTSLIEHRTVKHSLTCTGQIAWSFYVLSDHTESLEGRRGFKHREAYWSMSIETRTRLIELTDTITNTPGLHTNSVVYCAYSIH